MQLQSISIARDWQSPYGLKGTIQFKGQYGEVKVELDEKLTQEVIAVCAASMTRATKELAETLTAEVFTQANSNLLEAKDETL